MFSSFQTAEQLSANLGEWHAASTKGPVLIQLEIVRAGTKQNLFAMREKMCQSPTEHTMAYKGAIY